MWSAEQLARLAKLSDELLDRSVAERDAWLVRACEEHPDLATALAAMAKAPSSPLTPPPLTLPFEVDEHMPGKGDQVGPFRLISLLGQGGMGVVWLAEQVDGRLKRHVALKLLRLHFANPGLRLRFERERDILAGLSHPGIARIIDAHVSERGLAYLAIDHIDGEDILHHATRNASTPRTCVEQILALLDAVSYAHGRSVVHRDLKPSNVLVDRSGHVMLLDFGIAKMLHNIDERPEDAEGQDLTAMFGRALTLEYASPEQVTGQPLGVQTDVYSVGVMLYELLTGQGPYQLPHPNRTALAEAILSQQIEAPSKRVLATWAQRLAWSTAQLAAQLNGDLDDIVLRALRRDPSSRYDSAASFAADLRRWLAGQAVDTPSVRHARPMERAPQQGTASTASTASPPGPAKRIRDQIREHLSPTNTVMGLSLTLVSLADLLAPRLAPFALVLRNVALAVAALLIIAALWPGAVDKLLVWSGLMRAEKDTPDMSSRWRLLFGRRMLLPLILVAAALTATLSKANTGGVVASHVPSLRTLQQQLLGLQVDVKAIGDGVNKANQTLDAMAAKEQALQAQVAADPVSLGLLDLQSTGEPARQGSAWPARMAVYLNAVGYDFNVVQLRMAADMPNGLRHVENLSSALGTGSGPGAVQIMVNIPAQAQRVTACLLLPASADPARRALVHRWRVTPQPGSLRLDADGKPQLTTADNSNCAE